MSETAGISQGLGNPYKIVDHTREKRKGITASSLKELTNIARNRLSLPLDAELTIVLEQDGKKTFLLPTSKYKFHVQINMRADYLSFYYCFYIRN